MPVVDAALNALGLKQIEQEIKEYAAVLKQLANEATMIENQVRQIQYAYSTVQQGAQNLLRLDLNNASSVMGLINQLEGKLAQIDAIGYSAQGAIDNMTRLYPTISARLDADAQRVLALTWSQAQRDNAKIAMQVQAIRESKDTYNQRWTEVLNKAYAAQGSLQIEQANTQALGLVGGQLVNIESQLAVIGREQTSRNLRETTLMEMEQRANEVSGRATDTTYEARGRLLTMPRTR